MRARALRIARDIPFTERSGARASPAIRLLHYDRFAVSTTAAAVIDGTQGRRRVSALARNWFLRPTAAHNNNNNNPCVCVCLRVYRAVLDARQKIIKRKHDVTVGHRAAAHLFPLAAAGSPVSTRRTVDDVSHRARARAPTRRTYQSPVAVAAPIDSSCIIIIIIYYYCR